MSTTTTRLGLTKPAGTEDYDVEVFNANSDKLDAAVGAVACTSGTRPATPYPGQLVRETDTGRLMWWNSTAAAWQIANIVPVVVTTAGARPSGPLAGTTAHETDTGNMVVHDGTNWAHHSIPVVSALANVLRPYEGELVFLTTDSTYYRRASGAWVAVMPAANGAWTALTLTNSWANYGGTFQTARYRKGMTGIVEIQGLIASGVNGNVGTLPTGFRPSATLVFTQMTNPGNLARMDVGADGTIVLQGHSATWCSINAMFHASGS